MSISAPAIPKIRENGIEIPIDIRAQNIRLSDTAGGMDIETAIGDLRNNPFDLTHIERMIEDLQGQFAYFPYFVTREELKNQLDNISNALTEATKVILKDFAALKELEKLQAEISRLDKLENEIKYLATRIDKIELLGRKVGIADTPEDLHMALDDFLPMIPTINDFAIVNNPAQIWIIEAISPETGAIKWQAGPMLNTNIDLSGFA
ncbi:MAG: hypothetical protein FWD01_01695, partial [Defluviitaleaceae bacterium]|nr:hypothetical protein [Defluviitaleaceae bacterium]